MDYNGEIVFAIADSNTMNVDLGLDFSPTRIVNKGELIALGKKAPKNQWLHVVEFNGENEYLKKIEQMIERLNEKSEDIARLLSEYENVSIDIYIRSEFAEIGYSLPGHILKKIALLGCDINFVIFSFGMAMNGDDHLKDDHESMEENL